VFVLVSGNTYVTHWHTQRENQRASLRDWDRLSCAWLTVICCAVSRCYHTHTIDVGDWKKIPRCYRLDDILTQSTRAQPSWQRRCAMRSISLFKLKTRARSRYPHPPVRSPKKNSKYIFSQTYYYYYYILYYPGGYSTDPSASVWTTCGASRCRLPCAHYTMRNNM